MENVDETLLSKAIEDDFKIKKLYTQHKERDRKTTELDGRSFRTEEEELLLKQLKREKLKGKYELFKLIEQYKSSRLAC